MPVIVDVTVYQKRGVLSDVIEEWSFVFEVSNPKLSLVQKTNEDF